MRTLIVGARGQLGKELVAFAPRGKSYLATGRGELDITDQGAVLRTVGEFRPDLIINSAAYTAVDMAEHDADNAYAVNAVAVGNLAQAAEACGAHLVQVSTDYVFDGASPRAYSPDDARGPLSVYGRSKAAGEDAAGPRSTVIRTSWVYSAGATNFVTTMLRLMRQNGQVEVVADQIAAPAWAPQLAEAIWHLGAKKLSGRWHYSDAGLASRYDFAVAIAEDAFDLGLLPVRPAVIPIRSTDYPAHALRPAFSVLNSDLTLSVLHRPAVHWRANLRRMLAAQKTWEATRPNVPG